MVDFTTFSHIDPDENYFDLSSVESDGYFSVEDMRNAFDDYSKSSFFLNFNIRSFSANSDSMFCLLKLYDLVPDVICLTETWFSKDYTQPITGFNAVHTIRSDRNSGGVSIYIKESLGFEKISQFSFQNDNIEVCSVKIKIDSRFWIYICIYRPQNGNLENFVNHLDEILNSNLCRNKNIILAGDLNINILKNDPSHTSFLNLMKSQHFLPKISKPTRFSPTPGISPSLLDHIWVNSTDLFKSGIIPSDFTDHCPTFISIPLFSIEPKEDLVKLTFRPYSDENFNLLAQHVTDFDWDSAFSGDTNSDFKIFIEKLNSLYCRCFPQKIKYVSRKKIQKPWITPRLLHLLKYKNLMFTLYRKGVVTDEMNKLCKNKIQNIIRKCKENYYLEAFEKCKCDMKKTWDLIKDLNGSNHSINKIQSILCNGVEITDELSIANSFNNYFNSAASSLVNNSTQSFNDPLSYLESCVHSLFLSPVSSDEVSKIILDMKNKKSNQSSCPDHILKRINHLVSPTLSKLINSSFQSGTFPNCLKHAIITPVFKSGNKKEVSNYRPISVLSTYSKILEKCMLNRICSFLNRFNLITKNQYGFIKGCSTEDAVSQLTEFLYKNLNSKFYSIAIFIDFRKAFDTIDHQILFKKLESYGIRGAALSWFQSYLDQRKHSVKIGEKISDSKVLEIGLPQGSLLAPTLFLLFINDLPKFSKKALSILYADDTTLCFSGSNFTELIRQCNQELEKFSMWTAANKLFINTSKTNYMIITNRPINNPLSNLLINGNSIDRQASVKFLGIIIDEKLNFHNHIQHLCDKTAKNTGILNKMKHCVPTKLLNNLYYSLIYPYLIYCTPIWGGTFTSVLEPLRKIQKRAVRIVNKKPYLYHSNPLFLSSNFLKIDEIYKFKVSCNLFLNSDHSNFERTHNFNTRNRNLLLPNFQRLTTTQRSLTFAAPNIWNQLPDSLKDSPSFPIFKRNLKKYFIASYRTQ